MDDGKRKVVMAQMKPRERHEWTAKTPHRRRFKWDKRLLRRSVPLAAVFLCIGAAAVTTALFGGDVQAVMSHVTAGFEYDETLGRLQFVSNCSRRFSCMRACCFSIFCPFCRWTAAE